MPKNKYLKTSNKLRHQLLSAVSAATMTLCNEHVPAHLDGPPETWPEDQKKLWDLITEAEHRCRRNIEAGLIGARRMSFDSHADEMDQTAAALKESADSLRDVAPPNA